MLFKYPEILYALFLLLIPIIVHLFRLRRFRKEAFTNVKFLQKVELQTRRSSQLKKWLTLLARLLAMAALIFAFAQPYIPHSQNALRQKQTVVYIDNSFSMQQQGSQGDLMKSAVQQLLQTLPDDKRISVLTNDQTFPEASVEHLKNQLLNLSYSSADASFKTIALKAKNLFSKKIGAARQFIAISDFQKKNLKTRPRFDSLTAVEFIQLRGKNHLNFSIDSISLTKKGVHNSLLKVTITANRPNSTTLPVSLYSGNTLLAKSSVGFNEDTVATTQFSLSRGSLTGKLVIHDKSLRFDNQFYFSLQKPKKIAVVALNGAPEKGAFLKKIFNDSLFHFTAMTSDQLDYNRIEKANFVILNELSALPHGLDNILENLLQNGGSVCIIPSAESTIKSYNRLLLHLHLGQFSAFQKNPLKITTINFAHPVYTHVFNGKVTNFQYPDVKGYFGYHNPGSSVLRYNNGQSFLANTQHCYVFTAPINHKNSNFKNSPLIVPTFYNMARQSLKFPRLFYTIGQENHIAVPTTLHKDEVLHLSRKKTDFIPQQRRYSQKVVLTTKTLPEKAGTYQMLKRGHSIGALSFNYDRAENAMTYADMHRYPNAEVSQNVKDFLTAEINKNKVDPLWKWFVIFALVCLLTEVALLKFLK